MKLYSEFYFVALNYRLDEYSIGKVFWGGCIEHFKLGIHAKEWRGRLAHLLIAAAEALPIIGQIAALAEWGIVSKYGKESPPPLGQQERKVKKMTPGTPVEEQTPLERLPKDVHRAHIARELTTSTLAKLTQVSKQLHAVHQPIVWERIKAEITIGPKEWEKVEVIVTDVPPLPADIDEILKAKCPFFPDKRVFQTHKLVLMHGDASIDSQGKLTTLRGMDGVSTDLRQKKVGKPYWALITCDVIPDSRNQWYKDQKALVAKKAGYELPTVLEAITLVTMHLQKTGQYLLPENPWTYTRCKETNENMPLVVGAFAPAGLDVRRHFDYPVECSGVLAVRKL